jgi:PAP2 superfamily
MQSPHSSNIILMSIRTAAVLPVYFFLLVAAGESRGQMPGIETLWLGETTLQLALAVETANSAVPVLEFAEQRQPPVGPWSNQAPSLFWTGIVLDLVRKYQQNPLRAARALAYVNVSIHDAMILAARQGLDHAGRQASAHAAASAVTQYLYPEETFARYEAIGRAAYLAIRVDANLPDDRIIGWTLGTLVAKVATGRAATDGAGAIWKVQDLPPAAPGQWRASPPINAANPVEALAGNWRTWIVEDASTIALPEPTPIDSDAYWEEILEVLDISRRLTAQQKSVAERWNLDLGTVTPAGVWNRIAMDAAAAQGMDGAAAARLFSTLNAAMLDAFVICWRVKFAHRTERPVTAIRRRFNATFLPYILTPAFPSFPSGHATVSGAASEVLAEFFPAQAAALRAQAEEAAMSRLFGGIHIRSDNEQGLKLGRDIGRRALARAGQ